MKPTLKIVKSWLPCSVCIYALARLPSTQRFQRERATLQFLLCVLANSVYEFALPSSA